MPTDPVAGARSYPLYALVVLVLAYVLAFVDRQILNLLVEPIKRDLRLSDVEISLLQGLSFALFLSIAGLPIGRLIDSRRRTALLGCGIALWSLASGACGLARGFPALMLARIVVGVGEATITPAAYSLIGDWFSGRRQGLAMGLYSLGAYMGSGLALLLGAEVVRHAPTSIALPLIGALHGWQLVFLIVGSPGLIVAAWVATLREPARRGGLREALDRRAVVAWFAERARPLLLVNLAVAFAAMATYGLSAWAPAFLQRRYALPSADAGRALGLIVMVAGSLGSLTAGLLGDRLVAGNPIGRFVVLASGAILAAPLPLFLPFAPDAHAALLLIAPTIFLVTLTIGSGPAILQQITPPRLRGTQHAFAVLAVTMVGLGLGPTLVALVADHVLADEQRVGVALAIVLPGALACSALCAFLAMRPYRSLAEPSVA